ncbi:MAG TPA: hypothetical protein VGB97_01015 [Candidatus Paceibacterota bacterium]|jgi:hypothetical protein
MSSFGAAYAASTDYIPVPVIARETLHTGPVVKVKVPVGANDGAYPDGDEMVPFMAFHHNVPGGFVKFFVHSGDAALRGKTITASASVHRKQLQDDRLYLYVDLHPVDADTPVTHRLAVLPKGPGSWDALDHTKFETPAPINGLVIFAPPEAKLVPEGMVVQLPKPAPARKSTGDSQLDRLLEAGWEIGSENTTQVLLFHMKGDVRKTMTHYRPKKAVDKQRRR